MSLRPLGSRVLCERLPAKDLSPGGIVLIDREPTSQARVLRVGPDVSGVHPGDTIVFHKSCYEISQYEGREVLFIHDRDLLAVLGA